MATLLEIATRLGADPSVHNMMVRFAFFGGEESGAQGSSAYLEGLSPGDVQVGLVEHGRTDAGA
jgi:aminopeptidase S